MQILIIDDSIELLDLLSDSLTLFGWKIMKADNSLEALEIYKDHNRHLDAVLLDHMMPVMEGLQLLPKLLQINADIPVIMMTGHGSVTLASEFMKMGGAGFIEKPIIHYEILKIRIEEAISFAKQKGELETIRATRFANEKLNEAKDAFLFNLSHELRSPLTVIFPFAVMAKQALVEGRHVEAGVVLDRLLTGQERLMRFISNIECLARIYTGKYTYHPITSDLVQLVKMVVQGLKERSNQKGLRWYLSGLETLSVCFDARAMRVALTEVMDNAIKFSPEDGMIEVSIIRFENQILVSIIDSGEGIPGNECETIFDPFIESSRTSSHADGMGLGLSIVRGMVQLHGGTVIVKNRKEEKGLMVTLTLPDPTKKRVERVTVRPPLKGK